MRMPILKLTLGSHNKEVDFITELTKFFATALTGLAAFCILYPFVQNLGYPNEKIVDELTPFIHKYFLSRTNSVFLYVVGCMTVFVSASFYHVFVLPKVWRQPLALILEAVVALITLMVSWGNSFKSVSLIILLWRALTFFLIGKMVKSKEISQSRQDKITPKVTWGFYMALIGLLVWFFTHDVLKSALTGFKIDSVVKLLFFCCASYGFLIYSQRLNKYVCYFFDFSAIVLIIILTLQVDSEYFGYSNFLGSTSDILRGKDILVDIIPLYGFFDMYFLAILFKLFHVSDGYKALSIVTSIFYILGYASLYIFLRIYTKNVALSILSLLVILLVNFYHHHIPIHWSPNVGFFRFGAFLVVFYYLFCRPYFRNKKLWEWFFALFIVLSLFWVIETGVWVLVALIGVTLSKYLFDKDLKDKRALLAFLLKILTLFIVVIVLIIIRIFIKYGIWPNWADLFHHHRYHLGAGTGANPLKDFYLWPIPVVIYVVAIYVCLRSYQKMQRADAWLFLSFFGLEWLLYYVSQVIINNLARCALPALIIFFAFMGYVLSKDFVLNINNAKVKLKYPIYVGLIFLCAWFGFSIDKHSSHRTFFALIQDNPKQFLRDLRTESLQKYLPRSRIKQFRYDVLVIQRLIPKDEPAVIISKHDTLYHVYAKRKSFFKINFYPNFPPAKNDVPDAVDKIINSKVQYLFIDNSTYQCYNNMVDGHLSEMKTLLSKKFTKKSSLGLLDVYTRIK